MKWEIDMLTAAYAQLALRMRRPIAQFLRAIAARVRTAGAQHGIARALIGARVDVKFRLPRGSTVSFDHPAGLEIRCRSGVLWVTQETDLRDYVLGPGDAFQAGSGRPVLANALVDCCSFVVLRRAHRDWRMDLAAPRGQPR